MALYPGSLLPNPNIQFFDANGDPLASGTLTFYVAGTSTLQDTYSDSDLTTPNSYPITLNSAGRAANPIYLAANGYKVVLKDSAAATIWTRDNVQGWNVFPTTWGTLLGTAVTYTNGQTIAATTRLALIDSSSGATTVYLPASADADQPLCIKNMGANAVTVTPDGSDTIDDSLTSFTIVAASSPTFPTIELAPDGVSGWYIRSSHP
jgi:hypothetical protein